MNMSQSHYNSGCESGWTHYLDQSYLSASHEVDDHLGITKPSDFEGYEREEDLSMVSDASSGPPHYQDSYEEGCSLSNDSSSSKSGKKGSKKKKKSKESRGKVQQHHLDETDSSSVFNYYSKKKMSTSYKDEPLMQNVMECSEGFSATHIKGSSEFVQQFGYLNTSIASQKPGDFHGGSWE